VESDQIVSDRRAAGWGCRGEIEQERIPFGPLDRSGGDAVYGYRHLVARVKLRSKTRRRLDSSLGFAFVDEEHDIDVPVFRTASEEKRIPQALRNSSRHQEATPLHASRAQILKAQPDIAP
jgi:hypothetical protein